MATVVISPSNVANFINGGGGHCWVYLQYALGLQQLGCNVYWFERVSRCKVAKYPGLLSAFAALMEHYGLGGKFILYSEDDTPGAQPGDIEYLNMTKAAAEDVLKGADLLLNFHYDIDPAVLALFRRTALVDIDPGLLQFWIQAGQLHVPPHDTYLTTGETVGTPAARFSDCGLPWKHIRPPIFLDAWPYRYDPGSEAYTTVSNWWGNGDWIIDNEGTNYENNKRVTFLEFAELPRHTRRPLELALFLSRKEHDTRDRQLMESCGWRIRHSREVARDARMYQSYVQSSRGEFSCVKPSCIRLQNAWVSDRTLCYLASGKPVVVQDTGPSSVLPNGEGMFRFTSVPEAAAALAAIDSDYARHSRAARDIVETHFDATRVVALALTHAGL
jgi:hypothetical protein